MEINRSISIFLAISAAFCFAISIPISKIMLGGIAPLTLAGLIYLGAGLGMLATLGLASLSGRSFSGNSIAGRDLPWLAGSIAIGSVIAPALLMWSIGQTNASTASLLLSFEPVAAALVAGFVFGELIARRVWAAVGCITAACLVLFCTSPNSGGIGISIGALGVLAVAVLWGTAASINRRLSLCEPGRIVVVKCTAAGLIMTGIAAFAGETLPATDIVIAAMAIGFVAYGLSNLFLLKAMRGLGAARTSSLYGIYPLIGVFLSVGTLGESINLLTLAALPLMCLGVALIGTEAGPEKDKNITSKLPVLHHPIPAHPLLRFLSGDSPRPHPATVPNETVGENEPVS
jgi:drug/metabolite transporter (DMT)-like permease